MALLKLKEPDLFNKCTQRKTNECFLHTPHSDQSQRVGFGERNVYQNLLPTILCCSEWPWPAGTPAPPTTVGHSRYIVLLENELWKSHRP